MLTKISIFTLLIPILTTNVVVNSHPQPFRFTQRNVIVPPFNPHNSYVRRDACVSPSGKPGRCISLSFCPDLQRKFSENPSTIGDIFLEKSICGQDNYGKIKVCCVLNDPTNPPMNPPMNPTNSPRNPMITTVRPTDSTRIIFPDHEQTVNVDQGDNGFTNYHPNSKLLPFPNCGNPSKSFMSEDTEYSFDLSPEFIIGGRDAGLGTQPWMVLLGYVENDDPGRDVQYGCGGTLINSQYVLTAAHCIPTPQSRTLQNFNLAHIRIGEYDLTQDPDCVNNTFGETKKCAERVQISAVEDVILHPNYDAKANNENDIGLIRLRRKVNLGSSVCPICLPLLKSDQIDCSVKTNKNYMVTGWGRHDPGKIEGSNILQILDIPAVNHGQCQSFYESKLGQLDNTRFCAGGIGGQDSCQGDSGGPLLRQLSLKHLNNKRRVFQCGITSLGGAGSCATAGAPSIYTNVAEFVPWILDNLKP